MPAKKLDNVDLNALGKRTSAIVTTATIKPQWMLEARQRKDTALDAQKREGERQRIELEVKEFAALSSVLDPLLPDGIGEIEYAYYLVDGGWCVCIAHIPLPESVVVSVSRRKDLGDGVGFRMWVGNDCKSGEDFYSTAYSPVDANAFADALLELFDLEMQTRRHKS